MKCSKYNFLTLISSSCFVMISVINLCAATISLILSILLGRAVGKIDMWSIIPNIKFDGTKREVSAISLSAFPARVKEAEA